MDVNCSTPVAQNWLPEDKSLEEILAFIVEELKGLINKLEQLEKEYCQADMPLAESFSSSSERINLETIEIVKKQINFILNLQRVVEESPVECTDKGIIVDSIKGYLQFTNNKASETSKTIHQLRKEVSDLKKETDQLNERIATFSQLEESEGEGEQQDMIKKIDEKYNEAKTDLATVINTIMSEKNSMEYIALVKPIIAAYINNLDNPDKQFVELSANNNKVLNYLIDDGVIIRHETIPNLVRFNDE